MEERLYTYGALQALLPYCIHKDERGDLEDYLYYYHNGFALGAMSKIVYGVRCPYYWTYGRMREHDREYLEKAFEERNFSKWYNMKLLYPDCLPDYFTLIIDDMSGHEVVNAKIRINYLTFPYFFEDGENG